MNERDNAETKQKNNDDYEKAQQTPGERSRRPQLETKQLVPVQLLMQSVPMRAFLRVQVLVDAANAGADSRSGVHLASAG